MPNRIIRESALTSATLYRLSDGGERLFWRLTLIADDFGRFESDPQVMKARCFPLWPDKKMSGMRVASLYGELEHAELVRTYVVDAKTYGFFVTWTRHQSKRAKYSKYPEPRDETIVSASASTCAQMPAYVSEKRGIEKREARHEESAPVAPAPPVIQFQIPDSISKALDKCPHFTAVARLHDPAFWQAMVRAYPGVDFAAELFEAQGWVVANPTRAPKSDYPAFLRRWFSKAHAEVPA
jgi:hypothetical protein